MGSKGQIKYEAELITANKELSLLSKELSLLSKVIEKREAELITANKELFFQNEEKEKRAVELAIANKELIFQNEEKEKRAAELIIANKELIFQNKEKEKRASELAIANTELIFQNEEKEKRAAELIIANAEKEKRKEELLGITSTEKKILVAHLVQQQRIESIGTLAGGVAHEINNPLNGIMNYGQLILDSLDSNSENAEYAKEILSETNRIAVIVKNLMEFSSNENQQHIYANVNDIIESTLSLISSVMKNDQIDLKIDIAEDLPLLKCKEQQIQQVIMNLLTNAQDALNEKYQGHHENKIIKLNCKKFDKENCGWIRITIEDNGNGIPQVIKEKVFEPFFSSKSRDKGTGLGLYISHGIIKEHHGELTFETKEGKYTKFHIDLPFDTGWESEN